MRRRQTHFPAHYTSEKKHQGFKNKRGCHMGETGSGNICTRSVCPSLLLSLHLEFLPSHPRMAHAIACILESVHIQLRFEQVSLKSWAIRKTHPPFPPVLLHMQPPTDFVKQETTFMTLFHLHNRHCHGTSFFRCEH